MSVPKWFEVAVKEIGQKEIVGEADNPRIIEYHQTTTLKATDDEVAWCSSFVNWCFKQAGLKGTGSAAARSWVNWGMVLDIPIGGCVVVLKRGAPPSGHVCFFTGREMDGKLECLGGNQSDSVKISWYPKADVLAYRWPRDVPS